MRTWKIGMMVLALAWTGQADAQSTDGTGVGSTLSDVSVALASLDFGQADPADEAWRAARRELNDNNFRQAATMFRNIRRDFPESEYVGDSYYFEAFARYRLGQERNSTRGYDLAQDLLREQAREHPEAATRRDAESLMVQLDGAMARTGENRSAIAIAERARGVSERESSDQESCDSADQELQAMALSALLNMNAERAVPILREVLRKRDDCSVELRRQAVFLVSQKMDDEAVDILLDLAHRNPDPDHEVREQAVFWLSQVGGSEATEALIDILRSSEDEDIQENVIFALSQTGGEEAWEVLREYAERSDVSTDLRENAIFWLGQQRGGGEYLRDLYDRIDEPSLRENIIFGISQSGREEDGRWLLDRALDESEDIEVRKNALFWAGQIGMDVSRLAALYESVNDSEMKEQVIFVLSQSSDKREAVTQLMQIAESEKDRDLKQNAIFWLGQMDDPRVAEFLLKIIRSGGSVR